MPNEPVQCPNCGSGDVRQLAPDSYACEHCHTEFRWVDPTKRTVVHKSSVCKCGNIAAAFCARCQEPLCDGHRCWHSPNKNVPDDPSTHFCDIYSDQALNMLGEYGEYCGRSLLQCVERWGMIECIVELKPPSNRPWGYVRARPNWVLELLRNRGIDPEEQSFGGFVSGGFALGSSGGFALGCVLCEKCVAADWEVWGEVIKEVFTSYRQRIAEGQVCALCFSDRVERRCGVCGRAYCSFCSQCFFMREGCLRCKTPLVHGTTPAKVVKTAEATLLSRLRRFLRL